MKTYKADARNKETGELVTIESEYATKKEFIDDIRRNGYRVNPERVKTKEGYDYITQNTDCNPWDWKKRK